MLDDTVDVGAVHEIGKAVDAHFFKFLFAAILTRVCFHVFFVCLNYY